MKIFVILFLAALAGVAGYLMGTESGNRRRDDLVNRIRKDSGPTIDLVEEAGSQAAGAVGEAAQQFNA